MALERVSAGSSMIDVLDRVLDKGIVMDAWVRVSLVGIDLITLEARVVVASIATYFQFADALAVSARPNASMAGGTQDLMWPRAPTITGDSGGQMPLNASPDGQVGSTPPAMIMHPANTVRA
jgi:hypothetical protein